jgi:chemotaxis signal transduction protein
VSGPASDPMVTVFISGHAYRLPLAQVREAFDLDYLTPLPTAPPALAGLVNLRGEVVPAINLGVLLGRPGRQPRPGDTLLVVEVEQQRLALAVDRVVFSASSSGGPGGRVATPPGPASSSTTAVAAPPAGAEVQVIDMRMMLGLMARAVADAAEQTRLRLVPQES